MHPTEEASLSHQAYLMASFYEIRGALDTISAPDWIVSFH